MLIVHYSTGPLLPFRPQEITYHARAEKRIRIVTFQMSSSRHWPRKWYLKTSKSLSLKSHPLSHPLSLLCAVLLRSCWETKQQILFCAKPSERLTFGQTSRQAVRHSQVRGRRHQFTFQSGMITPVWNWANSWDFLCLSLPSCFY